MTTLPNLGIITPTLGGDSGTWDDKINAAFGLIDAHDHTSGKGLRIVTSALNINADLTFAGFGATSLGKAAFSAVAALAAGSKTLFVSSVDNELYWRNNSGTNVKLTSGTTINTSLVGGIGGDYSTVGADLDYDDANKRYTFRDETGAWARIASGPIRIHEYNTTETVYVEHAVAAGLAASYTVTWPAALPGAAALVQISAAGAVSFSNTTTGEITAADFNFTGTRTIRINAASAQVVASGGPEYQAGGWAALVSTGQLWYPITLNTGDRIQEWTLFCTKNSAAGTLTATLVEIDSTDGSSTTIGSADTDATNAPGAIVLTGGPALDHLVTGDTSYALVVTGGGTTGDVFRDLQVNITHPA